MDEVGVLRALLEAYSPSGREEVAVGKFVDIARSLGYTAHADRAGNGIARLGVGRPKVLFLGHIDTVEGELPVRLEGGRIHGRGACDAKGALAAALLAGSRHDGAGEVTVIGAVGEEQDSRGTRYLLPRHRPDALIVGEPSGWAGVTIGYRGNVSLVVRFDGNRSHLSSPERTTVEEGLAFVDRLQAFCERHRGGSPFRSLTAKVHSIDTRREGGTEHVEVGVNLRLPSGVTVEDVIASLSEDGFESRTTIVDRSEAVEVDRNNVVVRAVCAAIRRTGARPTLLRKLGTSDMNLAVPAWGCPAAAYGPGDAHLDHTDAESLEVSEYLQSIGILRGAFTLLLAQPPGVAVEGTAPAPRASSARIHAAITSTPR